MPMCAPRVCVAVREVLWLLNYQSDEYDSTTSRLVEAHHHDAFASQIDERIRDLEANARDARTIAPLLAAVCRLTGGGVDVDAMRDLLLYWSSPVATQGAQPEYAVVLRHVCYTQPLTLVPIFNSLELVDERGGGVGVEALGVPFGLVGLRFEDDQSQIAEQALLQLMRGSIRPSSGSALCLLRPRYVGLQPVFPDGTIRNAVLGGALDGGDGSPADVADDVHVWSLCRRIGLDDALIGRVYHEGWGSSLLVSEQLTHAQVRSRELTRVDARFGTR
jgi:hypothetical protein